MTRVTYNPFVFEQPNMDSAKAIIVTPEDGLSTEHRWEHETPYLTELIGEKLDLRKGQLVLDYGCGIGRLSKALIERFECRVLGVDISRNMRSFAPQYVDSPAFSVVSNEMLQAMVAGGLRVDAAISVWVLQHCVRPQEDIALVRQALAPGAAFFVLNNHHRAVPTLEASWVNDQLDVRALLADTFDLRGEGQPDGAALGPRLAAQTFWGVFGRQGA